MTVVGWQWMWQRTKRLADMIFVDPVLDGVQQVVDALDRYCELNGIDPETITIGDAKFIRGLQYVEFPLQQT